MDEKNSAISKSKAKTKPQYPEHYSTGMKAIEYIYSLLNSVFNQRTGSQESSHGKTTDRCHSVCFSVWFVLKLVAVKAYFELSRQGQYAWFVCYIKIASVW